MPFLHFGGLISENKVAKFLLIHESNNLFDKIDRFDITGCFCLTELGYGNNAVKMETTATFDKKANEFVVNSPTVLSQKYWITNGFKHSNYALVFA